MALADIIRRIEDDSESEVAEILDGAHTEAEKMVADAQAQARSIKEGILEEAQTRAERQHETALANARLAARDRTLDARHELVTRVLRKVEEALEALEPDDYARLLATGMAQAARGGEEVLVAEADAERLRGRIEAAVTSALAAEGREVTLSFPDETADIPRGALLRGSRMSVEVSPRSVVSVNRDELIERVSAELFGEGDARE